MLVKFSASFIYTVLFICKDTIIITTEGLGTELIPVLKGSVMIVAAFLVSGIYSSLTNRYTFDKVFKIFISFFMISFLVYGFILYPNRETLSLDRTYYYLLNYVGASHSYWLAIFRFWFHSFFYVIAEMWGSLVIVTLFWGTANTVNDIEQASRSYNIFSASGHLATIISGFLAAFITQKMGTYEHSIQILLLISFVFALIIYLNISYISKNFNLAIYKTNKKIKISFLNSLRKILSSKYLLSICLMVVTYGFTINMVEVYWKDTVKLAYSDAKDFQAIMSTVLGLLGLSSLLFSIFLSGNIIRAWGWKRSALLSPISIGLLIILFFVFYMCYQLTPNYSILGYSFVKIAIVIGAIHNVTAKLLKYCMFDPIKEMAYIPLSYHEKINGKAAIEVISSRLGKSGSSWMQIIAMEILGTALLSDTFFYLIPTVFVGMLVWIFAVKHIGSKLG